MIQWQVAYNGGSPIREYLVYSDQSKNNFTLLSPTIINPYVLNYQITFDKNGLIQGNIYAFKVAARNDVGMSDFSSPLVNVMAATISTPPT
jgi:hypothetical protein